MRKRCFVRLEIIARRWLPTRGSDIGAKTCWALAWLARANMRRQSRYWFPGIKGCCNGKRQFRWKTGRCYPRQASELFNSTKSGRSLRRPPSGARGCSRSKVCRHWLRPARSMRKFVRRNRALDGRPGGGVYSRLGGKRKRVASKHLKHDSELNSRRLQILHSD